MAGKRKVYASSPAPASTPTRRSTRTSVKVEDAYPTPPSPLKKAKVEPAEPSLTPKPVVNGSDADVKVDGSGDDKKSPLTPNRSPSALAKIKKLGDQTTSPFPDYKRPTEQDCQLVCDALESVHGVFERPKELVDNDRFGANCGSVPDVLDALIRTILSQNTSNQNSFRAKQGLDAAFGRSNYKAIHAASQAEVEKAIHQGGLANRKSLTIKKVLQSVMEQRGELSLNHLHDKSDSEAMEELVSFDGVGPKTASCVLLFCLGRESFAVDTHVFRITKSLGWIPAKADRETAFHHLNVRVTPKLKYALHSLLVKHGRGCANCSASGSIDERHAFKGDCPIKPFMRGKPRPKDVEENGAVGDDGQAVAPSTPSKPTANGKKGRSPRKTVKEAEEEAQGEEEVVQDQMHGLEVEEKKSSRKRSA